MYRPYSRLTRKLRAIFSNTDTTWTLGDRFDFEFKANALSRAVEASSHVLTAASLEKSGTPADGNPIVGPAHLREINSAECFMFVRWI
jgi:hypothetical protein